MLAADTEEGALLANLLANVGATAKYYYIFTQWGYLIMTHERFR